jgi:hypothetical protein
MVVNVRDIIGGDAAITFDLGVKVRDSFVHGDWRDDPLILDFTGVRNVTSSFLAQVAAPILSSDGPDQWQRHLCFKSVPSTFDLAWKKVLDAARAKVS